MIQDSVYLWLSTPTEVIRYNRQKRSREILASHSFLPRAAIEKRAFFLDANGYLWVGTNKGFAKIDTRRFQTLHNTPAPQVTSFSVFDKQKTFDSALADIQKITLQYNENFFSFGLSTLSYQNQNAVQYKYMLEGFDKDWKTANGNSASYTNVPPGTYYLKISSNTGAGGWIEKKQPIAIKINSPFWQTWWFITIAIVLLMSIIYWSYRLAQKRKQNKRVEETIDYFANSFYGENSINEICWDIARNCISHLKLEDCVVYLLDEKRNVLIQKAAEGTAILKSFTSFL